MRRTLGAALALLVATRAELAHADPGAPQVNPARLQREDARRLDDQQRRLDPTTPVLDVAPGERGVDPELAPSPDPDIKGKRTTGFVLLGISGVSALGVVTLLELDTLSAGHSHDTGNALAALLAATATVTGIAGAAVLLSSRRAGVQVAPSVTAHAVGLAIAGRL